MEPLSSIWDVALALIAIVGVVLALGFIARRLQAGKVTAGKELKILESTYLGPKERLVLVQVADSRVLFAMNAQSISKLHEYEATAPEEEDSTERSQPSANTFAQVLSNAIR